MVYKLNVTEHADELLDRLVYHLIYRLKNKQAAKHLLDRIDAIYDRADFISHMVVCIDFNGKEKADALAGSCRGCGMWASVMIPLIGCFTQITWLLLITKQNTSLRLFTTVEKSVRKEMKPIK